MEGIEAIGETSNIKAFDAALRETDLYPLRAEDITTFQVNVGRLCNQSCRHCHVSAGPDRTETMSWDTISLVFDRVKETGTPAVDITGGAPEMNPHYRWFVKACRAHGCRVLTRTNLTVLTEKGYEDIPEFWAENRIEVVASLPYFLEETTDKQRGKGVFARSVEALKRLNGMGYGMEGTGLILNLVYNPCGAFLPPNQKEIEADFRRELKARHGIGFTTLFTITNMPVGRFLQFLKDSGNLNRYLEKLKSSYNPEAARNVMCRNMISVGWDGSLYDCDFNQMLSLRCAKGAPGHIRDFDLERLKTREIVTGIHCYGCTAGAGSSCTGAVA